MIFVTVGTHEQPFNRLVKEVDELKRNGGITESVFIQTGYSTYVPQYCEYKDFISMQEMNKYVEKARIVITHGGPASFLMPIQLGKIPIVVPRNSIFNEHVNNHQVNFSKQVYERMGNIIPIYNIEELGNKIKNYNSLVSKTGGTVASHNTKFIQKFDTIIREMFTKV